MAAGVVTALAGLLFILNPETHFFPTVSPIIAWLVVRSVILLRSRRDRGLGPDVDRLSAGMDFLLARPADRRPVDLDPRRQRLRPDARS